MYNSSHLRLVFTKAAPKEETALLSMVNPDNNLPLFDPNRIVRNSDGGVELISSPMPVPMAAQAPNLIEKGLFPHLQEFSIVSFNGENSIYGTAAGMRVVLSRKENCDTSEELRTEPFSAP